MNPKQTKFLALGALALAGTIALLSAAPSSRSEQIARGRYIVEGVGMCADCHTARNEKGEFIKERWLTGAVLPFASTVPMPWAPASLPIAGLPTMTEDQAVTFLQTGKRPNGTMPLPPMPEYRFNEQDARAVAAYLKSLAK